MSARPAGEEFAASMDTLTPEEAQRWLAWCVRAMSNLRGEILRLRETELAAKHAWEAAVRRTALDPATPRISRGADGISKDYRDAWIDEKTHVERQTYEIEKVTREASQEHMSTLEKQAMIVMHLNKGMQAEANLPASSSGRWAS